MDVGDLTSHTCCPPSHLPAYLVAAFAKRLARLALTAPPEALLMVLPLICNLLRRHPACRVMVHRPQGPGEHMSSWTWWYTLARILPASCGPEGWVANRNGLNLFLELDADPYDPMEKDPARSHALDSCLWELQVSESLACPDSPPTYLQQPPGILVTQSTMPRCAKELRHPTLAWSFKLHPPKVLPVCNMRSLLTSLCATPRPSSSTTTLRCREPPVSSTRCYLSLRSASRHSWNLLHMR